MKKITAYSDGSCKGNPGPGGWGSVVFSETESLQIRYLNRGGKKNTTNQEMELTAFLEVLRMIPSSSEDVIIYTDSTYVLGGLIKGGKDGVITLGVPDGEVVFTGWIYTWKKAGWKKANGGDIKHLKIWIDIAMEITNIVLKIGSLNLKWVKGHDGNEGNELADRLANLGIQAYNYC